MHNTKFRDAKVLSVCFCFAPYIQFTRNALISFVQINRTQRKQHYVIICSYHSRTWSWFIYEFKMKEHQSKQTIEPIKISTAFTEIMVIGNRECKCAFNSILISIFTTECLTNSHFLVQIQSSSLRNRNFESRFFLFTNSWTLWLSCLQHMAAVKGQL